MIRTFEQFGSLSVLQFVYSFQNKLLDLYMGRCCSCPMVRKINILIDYGTLSCSFVLSLYLAFYFNEVKA